jgi:hypothetical protein
LVRQRGRIGILGEAPEFVDLHPSAGAMAHSGLHCPDALVVAAFAPVRSTAANPPMFIGSSSYFATA